MADAGKVKMWESLRADCRAQDNEIESRIAQMEALCAATDEVSVGKLKKLSEEIGKMLQKMQSIVLSMADSLPTGPEAATMSRHTQRFEDIIVEKQRAVQRLELEARRRRERAELLHKVHSEISVYNESSDMRTLASEQDSLRYTQKRTRELLDMAEVARNRLAAQRNMFSSIGDKVLTIGEKVPFINAVLKRIDQRRRKNVLILSIVIAICLMLSFIFW